MPKKEKTGPLQLALTEAKFYMHLSASVRKKTDQPRFANQTFDLFFGTEASPRESAVDLSKPLSLDPNGSFDADIKDLNPNIVAQMIQAGYTLFNVVCLDTDSTVAVSMAPEEAAAHLAGGNLDDEEAAAGAARPTPIQPQPAAASPSPADQAHPPGQPGGRQLNELTVEFTLDQPFERAGSRLLPVALTVTHVESKKQKKQGGGKDNKGQLETVKRTVPAAGVVVSLLANGRESAIPDFKLTTTSEGQVVYLVPLEADQTDCFLLATCEGKKFPKLWKRDIRTTIAVQRKSDTGLVLTTQEGPKEGKPEDKRCTLLATMIGGSKFRLTRLDTGEVIKSKNARVQFESKGEVTVQITITDLATSEAGDHIVFSMIENPQVKTPPQYISAYALMRSRQQGQSGTTTVH